MNYLIIILVVVAAIAIWFMVPYSPLKSKYWADAKSLIDKQDTHSECFKVEDFAHMPEAIRRYMEHCGYIGTRKKRHLHMEYSKVAFKQSTKGPNLTINYSQHNFVDGCNRLAMIDSRMFGIPFQGYDYYRNGTGGMKGVLAKTFTLFDQRGTDMDRACLVTYLAECLFMPQALLENNIKLEEVSAYQVRATLTAYGQSVSGVFSFNSDYEMCSFTTQDRVMTGTDGTAQIMPWSAICGQYAMKADGMLFPTTFKAVWNTPDGDFTYFDGLITIRAAS